MTTPAHLINANALRIPLASNSAQAAVSSPPYFNLRNYDHPDQVGAESSHDCGAWASGMPAGGTCFVCAMRIVFMEVRRCLRPDGVLWLNLGDSCNGSGGSGGDYNDGGSKDGQPKFKGAKVPGLKNKDLIGIPWRVAMALQRDGWWLRSDIVWAKAQTLEHDPAPLFDEFPAETINKGSAMPTSQQDRVSVGKEYIFMLTKSKQCYFDPWGDRSASGAMLRDVWSDLGGTANFKGAHFATFPEALPTRAIKLSTPEKGSCANCAAPLRRVVDIERSNYRDDNYQLDQGGAQSGGKGKSFPDRKIVGESWQKTCACKTTETKPAVVLDPFCGAATTGVAARKLGRTSICLDLNLDYLKIAQDRLHLGAIDSWVNGKKVADVPAGMQLSLNTFSRLGIWRFMIPIILLTLARSLPLVRKL